VVCAIGNESSGKQQQEEDKEGEKEEEGKVERREGC
jgi:hypothetical protein